MPTTSNFGWTTPADTDLVKDGAAAIRTLGNGIDSSLVDLKGGTTGQILSKASNTDLDYTWIANDQGDITEVQAGTGISVASGTGPIPVVTNTMATAVDAKGDLIVGTGADTFARLAVGTNGHTLVADSVETTGLKWVAPSSPTAATWTAALSAATTNPTIGNGFRNAYYIKVGKLVIATFEWQFGSTSTSGSGQYKINSADLPATTATGLNFRGFGWFTDASTGNKYPITLFRSGFDFLFYYGWPNGAGLVDFTAAAPVTIATNDSIDVQITYEASS